MTTFDFVHETFSGPSEHIPAMNEIKDLIEDQDFSANAFALGLDYANWETDEVRNLRLRFNVASNVLKINIKL